MASKNQSGTFNETKTVVIRDGTAVYTREVTATLIPGKMWSNYPAPYKTASPIYKKWIDKTTDIKLEGSNIRTRWPGNRLVDWSPKSIPASLLKQVAVGQPNTTISILSGQQLIVTSGKGAVTYTRVR